MRCYRHGWSTYSAKFLSASSRYGRFSNPEYPKLFSTTHCRIVDGRLFAKTEIQILPCEGLEPLKDCPHYIRNILDKYRELRHCCNHWRWTELYSPVFSFYDRVWSDRPIRYASSFLHGCLRRIQGCGDCYSDFALSAIDLADDRGRVVTLTCWKDLGFGYSINDPRWSTHLYAELRPQLAVRELPEIGLIAKGFELAARGKAASRYHPEIGTDALKFFCP